jgi:hypothetical protein
MTSAERRWGAISPRFRGVQPSDEHYGFTGLNGSI